MRRVMSHIGHPQHFFTSTLFGGTVSSVPSALLSSFLVPVSTVSERLVVQPLVLFHAGWYNLVANGSR